MLTTSALPDRVWILDAADGVVVDSVPLDLRFAEIDEPHGLAAAADGRFWYATVSHGESTLWKFERPGNRLVGRVPLGTSGAARIGLTPDGEVAFIPDYYRDGTGDGEVARVQLENLIVTRHRVCPGPHDAQVSPNGELVAITCSLSDEVAFLRAATMEEIDRVRLGPEGDEGRPKVKPLNLVWAGDGQRLYVTLHLANTVAVLDRSGTVLGEIPVGDGPAQLAMAPSGHGLLVANRRDGTASLVDLSSSQERGRIELGVSYPHGAAVSPDGTRGYVSFEGTTQSLGGVVAVDLESGEVVWRTEAGQYHLGVMYLTAPGVH